MRIWSIHPKYLDSKGLVALWREALLAKHVLEGKTKGYRNHPQLTRFKASSRPVDAINLYLSFVYEEATQRGYNFDKSKFRKSKLRHINVTRSQMKYEFSHLLRKLKIRDSALYNKLKDTKKVHPHPIFKIINGKIEDWEIVA
jgi:Pyrimidine dimer DNA glycosylase